MNLIKKSLLFSLVLFLQAQSAHTDVASAVSASTPNVASSNTPDLPPQNVSSSISKTKLFVYGIPLAYIARVGWVCYKNRQLSNDIDKYKKIIKELNNGKIKPTDTPEDIEKKWGMRGWRIKSTGLTYRSDISIPDANYIFLNEPTVVECLYNDLKFREIHLVDNKELIKFSFEKSGKNAYKSPSKDVVSPIVVGDNEVPTINTLKSLHKIIENDIKGLLSKMEEIDKACPLKESLAKLLVKACKDYQKTDNYSHFIQTQKDAIDLGDNSDDYKGLVLKILNEMKDIEIDDVSDLYLFNNNHLFKDAKDGSIITCRSILFRLTDFCKKELEGAASDKKEDKESIKNRFLGAIKENCDAIKSNFPKSVEWGTRIITPLRLDQEKSYEKFKQIIESYLNVAVSYARLVRLSKVVSKIINMTNGFEDKPSDAELLQKKKDKINKTLTEVIDSVEDLKDNDKVSYIVLEDFLLEINKVYESFFEFDLIKIYGTDIFKKRLRRMLLKVMGDIKNISSYFGPNTPMKNDDDDDFVGNMFGGVMQRPMGRATIYVQGFLSPDGLKTLRENCSAWMIGLKELEKQSKK